MIYANNKMIYQYDTLTDIKNSAVLKSLDINNIQTLNVLNGVTASTKYGDIAKNGAIEIYLKDEKYPGYYKNLLIDTIKKN